MTRWVGAQDQVTSATKARKHASIVTSPTQNPKPKTKIFFLKYTRRLADSVDGLNSSLAPSFGELWSCKLKEFKGF